MANRLSGASSQYLQQHADNPVDWFPWGPEAFQEAEQRGVPVFLSVGYSSCHWCHVMARESFEDDEIAAILNARFVSVKVDREERPDIDSTYMRIVRNMTNRGGWPMSVFLTPAREPFYAGSFWPKERQRGTPSFREVLIAVSTAWSERHGEVVALAESIVESYSAMCSVAQSDNCVDLGVADHAADLLLRSLWDRQYGGFGTAPKFPNATVIEWLLYRHTRTGEADVLGAAVQALTAMIRGGIHDQLGGGFARYTVDRRWRMPHFEKMLYDNALLLPACAAAAALTGRADLARAARSTADYLLTDLRTDDGVFVSGTDADTQGVEGAHFTWSVDELAETLSHAGIDPGPWLAFLGVSHDETRRGASVLSQAISHEDAAEWMGLALDSFEDEWCRVRGHLLARRQSRPPLVVNDVVLTDWNALAARGLVRAGVLLGEVHWVRAGSAAVDFLHRHLVLDDGLRHAWKNGRATVDAFLLDHAALALADLELFQATGEPVHFDRALDLASATHLRFGDANGDGWFQTTSDADDLYTRLKDTADNGTPSGCSVMVEVCLALAALTGDHEWRERADGGIRLLQDDARTNPVGNGWALRQVEAMVAGPTEVVIVGVPSDARQQLAQAALIPPRPGTITVVTAPNHEDAAPLLAGRRAINALPTAYVCRDFLCSRPVTTTAELQALLEGGGQRTR